MSGAVPFTVKGIAPFPCACPLHTGMTISSVEVITPPAELPVSLAEVKLQTRVDSGEEDALLASYVGAARAAFERLTEGRVLTATTFKEYVPSWGPCNNGWRPLKLSRGKVTSITSVTYYDEDHVQQNLTGHSTDLTGVPCLITMDDGSWPALSVKRARPITVTYTAGWPTASAVPPDIKLALLSLVAHWYWTREAYAEVELRPVPLAFVDFCSLWSTGRGGF